MESKYRLILERFIDANRVVVSRDMDRLAAYLLKVFPDLRRMSLPSGTDCHTWLIPPAWNVHRGIVRDADSGEVVIDYRNHPLHVISYSQPFHGTVSRAELARHLHYDRLRPQVIPYHYRLQYEFRRKEWGFCLSYRDYRRLTGRRFAVELDTEFRPGAARILDWHIRGRSRETLLFAAHTCHQGQLHDGLLNCVLGLQLFDELARRNRRRRLHKSYRLVLGPEYYAAAGFLRVARDTADIRRGVFLDLLGMNEKFAVGGTAAGHDAIDRLLPESLAALGHAAQRFAHRQYAANDELFYNSPDVNIPMAQFYRYHPQRGYARLHSSADRLATYRADRYRASLAVLRRLVNLNEQRLIPVKRFTGVPYLHRYNLYIDATRNKELYHKLHQVLYLIDGRNSIEDIAAAAELPRATVSRFLAALRRRRLLDYL